MEDKPAIKSLDMCDDGSPVTVSVDISGSTLIFGFHGDHWEIMAEETNGHTVFGYLGIDDAHKLVDRLLKSLGRYT